MKTKHLIILMGILQSTLSFAQGHAEGNGGHVLECVTDQSLSYELLDKFEAAERHTSMIIPGNVDPTNWKQIAIAHLNSVSRYNPELIQEFINEVNTFDSEAMTEMLPDSRRLSFIYDAFPISIPTNCEPKQLAVNRTEVHSGEHKYTIQALYWNQLSPLDKAATAMHEIFYNRNREHTKNPDGSYNSTKARYINGQLMSGQLALMSEQDFQTELVDAKVIGATRTIRRPDLGVNLSQDFIRTGSDELLTLRPFYANVPGIGSVVTARNISPENPQVITLTRNENNSESTIRFESHGDLDQYFGGILQIESQISGWGLYGAYITRGYVTCGANTNYETLLRSTERSDSTLCTQRGDFRMGIRPSGAPMYSNLISRFRSNSVDDDRTNYLNCYTADGATPTTDPSKAGLCKDSFYPPSRVAIAGNRIVLRLARIFVENFSASVSVLFDFNAKIRFVITSPIKRAEYMKLTNGTRHRFPQGTRMFINYETGRAFLNVGEFRAHLAQEIPGLRLERFFNPEYSTDP